MMIFDSHAHYNNESFDDDRQALLPLLRQKGVGYVMNAAWDIPSAKKAIEIAQENEGHFAAVGIHPEAADTFSAASLDEIAALLQHPKAMALGEIGLDYHYETPLPEVQLPAFAQQLALAGDLKMPVIIHSRDAAEPTLELVKKHRPKGIVHCFSGSRELALEYVKLGLYVGLTGVVTFKNAVRPLQVAQAVPLDRLLIETDCPYMAPVPFRGKRSDSSMLTEVAKAIAAVRGISAEEVIEKTCENAKRVYEIA